MKPKQEDPKEMVGGCCVCSDENGWTENPLVYCDGQGCNVAVHQACYGIVTVPTGSWFCRKCESQERAARVRCELCPAKDGALKRTDSGGWAHVVCALYIPEVRFGNVTTMEPIMLQLIPPERFNKMCYICEESSKGNAKSQMGACMQCNRQGCKNNFHVTCAQSRGLLCEEAGNYLDNVKYCGYCSYHYNKLLTTFSKRGSHVKTIPPYRPVPPEHNSSDEDNKNISSSNTLNIESAIKDSQIDSLEDFESKDHKQKKRSTKFLENFDSTKQLSLELKVPSSIESGGSGSSSQINFPSISESSSSEQLSVSSENKSSAVSNIISAITSCGKVEESRLESEQLKGSLNTKESDTEVGKSPSSSVSTHSGTSSSEVAAKICSLSGSVVPSISLESLTAGTAADTSTTSMVTSASSVTSFDSSSSCSVTTSSDFKTSGVSTIVSSSRSGSNSKLINSLPISSPAKESVSIFMSDGMEKEKQRKLRRNGSKSSVGKDSEMDVSGSTEEESPSKTNALTICEEKNLSYESKGSRMKSCPEEPKLNVQFTANVSAQAASRSSDNFSLIHLESAISGDQPTKRSRSNSQDRGRRNKRGAGSSGGSSKRGRTQSRDKIPKDSEVSSPDSFSSETIPISKRAKAKKTEMKDVLGPVVTNGVGANTLLLGNQINPSSAMAQKMADTLNEELEAHSIYKEEEKVVTSLIGPALPGKRETSTPGSVLNASQPPPLPQSLEQLLERQWEQGSQFLMEQAQHFDIASLLSCLHQLRQENVRLVETVNNLVTRRDHLLAVNARLSVPLSSNPQPSASSSSQSVSSIASTTSSMISITPTGPPPNAPSLIPPPSGGGIGSSHVSQLNCGMSRGQLQARHPSGGSNHPSMPSTNSGRGGVSPLDRRSLQQGVGPMENGLAESEYRYRSPGSEHQHRQQSPMLPPSAQPSPTSLRQSPASYHSGSSPQTGVPSLSPSGGGGNHPPMLSHSMVSPHGSMMVTSSHRGVPPEHSRAELVRLSSSQQNPNYPAVFQMVSPPVPHHSPVPMSHPQSHSQVMRRDNMDKR